MMQSAESLPVQILISSDKPDGLYLPGEVVEFRIAVMKAENPVSSGELSVYAAQDGGPGNCKSQRYELSKENPVTLTAAAGKPCFFLCRAEYNGLRNQEIVWYRTPEQLEKVRQLNLLPGTPLCPSLDALPQDPPEPADFEAFWERTLREARELPCKMQLEELSEYALEKCRYYRFSMNTFHDERVHGFLGVPNGSGPFPVIAMFPGKGPPVVCPTDCGWGSAGCITLDFSVHKFPAPATAAEAHSAMKAYEAQHGVSDYWKIGADSPEKFHFYSVISGFCRCLDYVTEKLPWDKKHLVLSGGSQGGWMTIVMSALYREKVSALYVAVPACGLASALRQEETKRYLPYFDADYFARRVSAPALITTGLNDTSVARPDVICAMFRLLGSSVKKLEVDRGEHMMNPLRQNRMYAFLMRYLGLADEKPERIPPFCNELIASRGGMLRDYYRNLSEAADCKREERLAQIKTAVDFELYRKEIREKLRQVFGLFPQPKAIGPQITGEFSTRKLTVEKIIFQSRSGFYVSALLYRPKTMTEKLPAILFLCGHNFEGKAAPTYDRVAQSLALRGFGVLSVDPYGQGERREFGGSPPAEHNRFGNRLTLLGEFFGTWRLHDALCALEYLKSRPEIDSSRMGVTGCSGGGTLTSYVNAFSDDIIMAAPVCSITRMSSNLENELYGDCEQCPPRFRALGLDEDDLFLLQSPRPILLGVQDNDFFDPRGTQKLFLSVQKFYALAGKEQALQLVIGKGNHGYSVYHQQQVGKFFAEIAGANAAGDDGDIEPLKAEQFLCTPSGRVWDLPGALSSLQMLKKLYREKKKAAPLTLSHFGINQLKAPFYTKGIQQYIAPVKLYANRFSLQIEPGIEIVLKKLSRFVEKTLPHQETAVLFLPEQDGLREVDLRAFRRDPENFYILELRGCGETMPSRPESDVYELFTKLYASNAFLFGDEMFLCHVRDLLSALTLFKEQGIKEVVVLAAEKQCAVAAAAAAFSPVKLQLPFAVEENLWKKFLDSPELPLSEGDTLYGAL